MTVTSYSCWVLRADVGMIADPKGLIPDLWLVSVGGNVSQPLGHSKLTHIEDVQGSLPPDRAGSCEKRVSTQ